MKLINTYSDNSIKDNVLKNKSGKAYTINVPEMGSIEMIREN